MHYYRANSLRWVILPKPQKLLTKFPGLATSGRHHSAMITSAENSRPNGPHTGCLVYTFKVSINSVFPLGYTLRTRKRLTQIFGNVRCPILSIDMALVRPNEQYVEKNQTELETESK